MVVQNILNIIFSISPWPNLKNVRNSYIRNSYYTSSLKVEYTTIFNYNSAEILTFLFLPRPIF